MTPLLHPLLTPQIHFGSFLKHVFSLVLLPSLPVTESVTLFCPFIWHCLLLIAVAHYWNMQNSFGNTLYQRCSLQEAWQHWETVLSLMLFLPKEHFLQFFTSSIPCSELHAKAVRSQACLKLTQVSISTLYLKLKCGHTLYTVLDGNPVNH